MLIKCVGSILCYSVLALSAYAQVPLDSRNKAAATRKGGCPASSPVEKRALTYECEVNCGVLNYPRPEYPTIAKAANVSGEVVVQIVVSKAGRVVAARPVSGHPLLLKAAVEAACEVRYSPAWVSGRVVAFKRKIKYTFKPPAAAQPNNGIQRTRIQQVFYHQRFARAANAGLRTT